MCGIFLYKKIFIRLLTYMVRATFTLPASLLTAHYIKSEIVNPFEAFLNTFQRTNNTNEIVSKFCHIDISAVIAQLGER